MKAINLDQFGDSQIENMGAIMGGLANGDCDKYTQQVDYTNDCDVDDTCWVCDDVIIIYPR